MSSSPQPHQPGLFDESATVMPSPTRGGRGRARETYARTVVAELTVHDPQALQAEALRQLDEKTVVIGEYEPAEDEELMDPREEILTGSVAAAQWCLEPTTGLWPLLETDAVRIDAVDLAAEDVEGPDDEQGAERVRLGWTVTVRLRDPAAARELARSNCPATEVRAHTQIGESFAAVWRWAADPHAPLADIPGVTWEPVEVAVRQVPARERYSP